MANEKQVLTNCQRLIDPSVIIRDLTAMKSMYDAIALDGMIKALKEAPTVDAVEVVRCKNCRDCEMGYPEKRLDREATQAWLCKRYKRHVKPDDFCSYGERREGNVE